MRLLQINIERECLKEHTKKFALDTIFEGHTFSFRVESKLHQMCCAEREDPPILKKLSFDSHPSYEKLLHCDNY